MDGLKNEYNKLKAAESSINPSFVIETCYLALRDALKKTISEEKELDEILGMNEKLPFFNSENLSKAKEINSKYKLFKEQGEKTFLKTKNDANNFIQKTYDCLDELKKSFFSE